MLPYAAAGKARARGRRHEIYKAQILRMWRKDISMQVDGHRTGMRPLPDRHVRGVRILYSLYNGLRDQAFAQHINMKSRDVIRKISAAGWFEVRIKGSHHQFKHGTRRGVVTVPHPESDLPKGTLRSIERQSGVKLARCRDF